MPLSAGDERAGQGGSCPSTRPDDQEEPPTTGLGGTSSRPRFGRTASLEVEAPAPRPALAFLPEGDDQLSEFISARTLKVVKDEHEPVI